MGLSRTRKLRSLPVQIIETKTGAILKRGRTEIEFGTKDAAKALQFILSATQERCVIPEDIWKEFPAESVTSVRRLLKWLVDWRILVPQDCIKHELPERSLDVFYWEFNKSAARAAKQLNRRRFAVWGVNYISRQLALMLRASGHDNFAVIDIPELRNLSLFDKSGYLMTNSWFGHLPSPKLWNGKVDTEGIDCLVGTSDFGGNPVFLEFNKSCISKKVHFMPVILRDLIGYVGPLVVPGETACFECLQARQNSNLDGMGRRRAIEEAAFNGQHIIGFHPSMASILGDIAAFELTKFYSGAVPHWTVGTLFEVDLLKTSVTGHRVLKIPRCPVCSSMNSRVSNAPDKSIFIPLDGRKR